MPLPPTLALAVALASGESARLFDRVQPLLAARCVSCHGPDKQSGGLRLDSRAAAEAGGESGPSWVPNDPDKSLIVQAVRGTRTDHPGVRMPPKDPLSVVDVAELTAWVKAGAVWPDRSSSASRTGRQGDAWTDPDNPVRKAFRGERLDLWSLKPPARPAVPAVADPFWSLGDMDRFVLAKLEAAGLRPSAEADRRTLIRRLTFDLHGLPPAPAEIDAFAADQSPDAYEKLADRLLASPRYGERWARHWLDVVRYADTNGFERDEFRPAMWRYRDYVVRALNADVPYDRFVREQLAGDELAAGPVRTAADADRWAATGFLRLGPFDTTAALFGEDARGRDQLLADLTNTTASAFLGLTYSCCQCHDHKYDPLTQADHYRLRAYFAAVKPVDDVVLDLPAERDRIERHGTALDRQIADRKGEQAKLVSPIKSRLKMWREALLTLADHNLLAAKTADLDAVGKKRQREVRKRLAVSDEFARRLLLPADKAKHQSLADAIDGLQRQKLPSATAVAMTDAGREPPPTHVLYQGDYQQPRAEVLPGPPTALDPNPATVPPVPTDTTGRRTALADWITRPDNPFTARVLVNRVWHHHFGRGLVATPNDFGFSGTKPTHPELLDFLATEFVRDGWSLKKLHRRIVTSAAYRQASADDPGRRTVDPDNRLWWRQSPRRLDAESLRDAVLSVSGKLRPDAGGPARWPHVPEEVLLSSPAIYEAREGKAEGRLQDYYTDPDDATDVRSVFLIQKRSVPYPFLQPFDLPDPTVSCGCRSTTTVAPQALALLNSPPAARLAAAFAARLEREASDTAGRINRAFRLALGRAPTADERELAKRLTVAHGLTALCRAVFNLNEFAYLD